MSSEDLSKKLHPLERKTLPHIKSGMTFEELLVKTGLKDVEVMRALQWLENKELLKINKEIVKILTRTERGDLNKSLPEIRFLFALQDGTKRSKDEINLLLSKSPPWNHELTEQEFNASIGVLRKKKSIEITNENGRTVFHITAEGKNEFSSTNKLRSFLKTLPKPLQEIENKEETKTSLERGITEIKENKVVTIHLTKLGEELSKLKISDMKVIDKLTSKDLKEKKWQGKEFRQYDVEINVPQISGGKRHFENQVIEYIKSIWLELGFKEMTGSIVHTSFWDLDSLFVPQDHPAREMQDTFYLKNPKFGKLPEKELVNKVRKTHENGWTTGSLGWQTDWSEEKAKENLLRTHTTVLSAQTISRLKKEELPAKFFAVGKCFRNETLDWKHLFEFYQVEGIVVDDDANFSNLLGYLKEFFKKMGFPDVRIRPGHFPYTEPSAEVDVWHPVRKQWVELGGSGIFRPEVTKPLIGTAVPVLAWGIGLGRMITEYWELKDIRDLYKNDIKQLRDLKVWLK